MFGRKDDELDEEIRAHLQIEARLREERGASPSDAMRAAERDFGNVLLVKETTRESWGSLWLQRLMEDVRYGVRLLARSKAFTATLLLVLAIGIGSVTAVFALVDAASYAPGSPARATRVVQGSELLVADLSRGPDAVA